MNTASNELFHVRPVNAADVDDVERVVRSVLPEFGLEFGTGSETDAAIRQLPGAYRNHGGEFWVATNPIGHVVGTCGIHRLNDVQFELRKMYLMPSTRGHGLGRRLLASALAFVRDRGGKVVVLDTHHEMRAAIAFYEANGFIRDDSQMRASRCTRGYRLDL